MQKSNITLAAGILLFAVALGAFGAHGLEGKVAEQQISNWQTGVTYQFYHGLAILFLGLAGPYFSKRMLSVIRTLFMVGIALFSGSLYLLSVRELIGIQDYMVFLGPLTPIGGLAFISGWAMLMWRSLKKHS